MTDSNAAWFRFEKTILDIGIKPGAFTSFTCGYEAAQEEIADELEAILLEANRDARLDAIERYVESMREGKPSHQDRVAQTFQKVLPKHDLSDCVEVKHDEA